MTLFKWSQVAAADATADSSINWQEGQAPSSVNDSARAMMAATAKYRDDIAGAIVTGGTSTSYTLSSYQQFDSFTSMNGAMIAFTPHATNGAGPVYLNADSLGQKYLRSAPSADLAPGVLIQGTPYCATYNNTDGAWYLHGFFGNPYGLPVGGSVDYWGGNAPNSSFAFMYGQAVSRTTYAGLFAIFGTNFGGGDGSTTFNIPDCRGRIVAGSDIMGGTAASRLTGATMSGLYPGAVGGSETQTLTLGQLPTGITSGNANQPISVSANNVPYSPTWNGTAPGVSTGSFTYPYTFGTISFSGNTLSGNNSIFVTSNNTGGGAHVNVQPTILANKLLRVI
jgi:microcystin-dependent protein